MANLLHNSGWVIGHTATPLVYVRFEYYDDDSMIIYYTRDLNGDGADDTGFGRYGGISTVTVTNSTTGSSVQWVRDGRTSQGGQTPGTPAYENAHAMNLQSGKLYGLGLTEGGKYTWKFECNQCNNHSNDGSGSFDVHTHSAPTGGSAGYSDVTQTSIKVKWGSGPSSWGCSSASKWYFAYKKSTDSSYSSWIKGDSSNTYNLTGLSVNTNYNIKLLFENAHGYQHETSAITVKTHGATPIVSVSNGNKFNNKNEVSASTNSITVSASNSANNTGVLTWTYRIKKEGGSFGQYQSSNIFNNLTSGTKYVVEALATNADGYSNSSSITIRTKYSQSNFTTNIESSDIGLEHINFTASVQYGDTNVISSGIYSIADILTGNSITVIDAIGYAETGYKLDANTLYTISVSAILIEDYDSIECNFSKDFTTDAKSSFSYELGDFEFCYSTQVAANYKITNPSGNKTRCTLIVGGADILNRDRSSDWNSQINLQLTDSEWDSIYKKLGNNNSVPYEFNIYTYSNKNENYSTYVTKSNGIITLTGLIKTAHIGIDNIPQRAQCFIGIDNIPKKAVAWIGDENNKPRRCI